MACCVKRLVLVSNRFIGRISKYSTGDCHNYIAVKALVKTPSLPDTFYLSVSVGSNKSKNVTWHTILNVTDFLLSLLSLHSLFVFLNSDFITDARVLIDFYIISLPIYSYSSNLV